MRGSYSNANSMVDAKRMLLLLLLLLLGVVLRLSAASDAKVVSLLLFQARLVIL